MIPPATSGRKAAHAPADFDVVMGRKGSDMATAPVIEHAGTNDIAVVVAQNPVVVLVDQQKREALYEHIQREIDAFEPDITTAKGRDAVKSLAYKITRTKTAIDDAGKKLNEDKRAQINAVDAERRAAKERLTALAAEVRQPLTDWEEAEKARIEGCRADIDGFKAAAVVTLDDTAATVRGRGKEVWSQEIDPERFGDMLDEAVAAKDTAVVALKAALARLAREEEERAELERLRQESAAREACEREEQEAREQAARAAAEAAAAAERKAAAEKAEAERIERAREEAANAAVREAEQKAQAERDRVQREHEEALAAERQRTAEAARAAQAEIERVAREEDERQAQADREAADRAEREADQAHRTKLKTAAKEAIIALGVPEAKAIKVVQAVVAGDIPHIRMEF